MHQELEFEAKNLLTKQEYQMLVHHLNPNNKQPQTQVNHYFETDAFALKSRYAALRIRVKHQQQVLTLKQPHQDGILETHQTITIEVKDNWLNNEPTAITHIDHALQKLGIDRTALKYQGTLETDRIELTDDRTLIVLDKSRYNNHVDYELEIEADNIERAQQKLEQLLDQYQIKRKPTPNKIERFYQTL